MFVRAASSTFACLALLAASAPAQDTYDLRQIMGRKPAVGERVRVSIDEHRSQRMGPRVQEVASSSTYVEEVLAVGEDGEPTRLVRAYEAYKDATGADLPVDGVKVELTRDEATGKHTFAPAEGSSPLPDVLEEELRGSVRDKDQRAERGMTDEAMNEVMFPAGAVPVGHTWSIDVASAVRMLGMPEADIDVAQSTVAGRVEGVEQTDGHARLKFSIEMRLMMKGMRGRPLPAPAPLVTTMTFRLPVAGGGPDGDTHMVQHMAFDVPGPQGKVTVTIDGQKSERRARVE